MKQSADNFLISDHLGNKKYPLNSSEWGSYLAGLIYNTTYFIDNQIIIPFEKQNIQFFFYLKKSFGYGQIKNNKFIIKNPKGVIKFKEYIKNKEKSDWFITGYIDKNGKFKYKKKEFYLELEGKYIIKNNKWIFEHLDKKNVLLTGQYIEYYKYRKNYRKERREESQRLYA